MLLGPARGSTQPRSLKKIAVGELHDPEMLTRCLREVKEVVATLPAGAPMTAVIVKDSWSRRHDENIAAMDNK
jgi:hypothetical protein